MRGTHRIIVQNRRIRYDFEIKRNITVIRGDSATGKTALVDMVREYYENGAGSAIELTCDKQCTVLEGRTWAGQLSMMQDSIVFIDEGNDFVTSDEFAAAIQKTDNYYVLVTREAIPSLPYSVEEIYGIRDSGKYGTLKKTYNEFYHLYQMTDFHQTVNPQKLITEDSNAGFEFFRESAPAMDCDGGMIQTHKYFPLYIKLEGEKIVVFGAGEIAARRAAALARTACELTVIAPECGEEMQRLLDEWRERITYIKDVYRSGSLMEEDMAFVFAATDDAAVNEAIYRECRHRDIHVNVASDHRLCSFYFPATVEDEESGLLIAVASTDASKQTHRQVKELRQKIEDRLVHCE